jgi:hypothetical protein
MSGWIWFVAETVLLLVCMYAFERRGYKRGVKFGSDAGYKAGYLLGKRDADNWWIGAESEVNQERRKLREQERRAK